MPKLTVVVSAEARAINGLSVSRDGVSMGEAQFGVSIPVDLGSHTVHVSAPHRKPWDGIVEVKQEGETLDVKVPALEPDGSTSGAALTAPPASEPASPAPSPGPSTEHTGKWRTAGYVVGGVGVVGLGIGAGFGVAAISKNNQSGPHCGNGTCDSTGGALRNSANGLANGANVSAVLGALALAGGAVMVFVLPSDKPANTQVAIGPGGMFLEGRW